MISLKPMRTETIKLIVRPNSRVNDVCGIYMDRVKIRLAAAPEKGKANKELIKFISGRIGIPKKFIKIISGRESNYKEINITSDKYLNLTLKLISG